LEPLPEEWLRRAKPSSLAQHRINDLAYMFKLLSAFVAHPEV